MKPGTGPGSGPGTTPSQQPSKPSSPGVLTIHLDVNATKTRLLKHNLPVTVPTRSDSNARNKANDRLQERLARAIAAKQTGASAKATPSASPRQSVDGLNRNSTEATAVPLPASPKNNPSPRASLDSGSISIESRVELEKSATHDSDDVPVILDDIPPPGSSNGTTNGHADESVSAEIPAGAVTEIQQDRIKQLEKALEEMATQQAEETHNYVEQIDALQAKLQYLAREATDSAKKEAREAPVGSLEKKLAEKDQKIAGLMEEGKNLASTELKLRAAIKSLRSKVGEHEKEINDVKTSRGKADQELDALRRKARRTEDLEKYQEELHKRIGQSQKEIGILKSEMSNKDKTVADLKAQLQRSAEQAEALTAKVNEEALAKEKRRVQQLEDEMHDVKVEKELAADRARARENELQERAERAAERTRATELELKAEIQVMESKLESMRTMAEEVSSGAMGDSQAKLLRQVETLQTQYAIATENWQGIESTLLSRIANLEKERDEAQQRESEMRKKAREAVGFRKATISTYMYIHMYADCHPGPPRQTSRGRTRRRQDTDTQHTGRCKDVSVSTRIIQEAVRRGRGSCGRDEGRVREAQGCCCRSKGSDISRAAGSTSSLDRYCPVCFVQIREQARVTFSIDAITKFQHRTPGTWRTFKQIPQALGSL